MQRLLFENLAKSPEGIRHLARLSGRMLQAQSNRAIVNDIARSQTEAFRLGLREGLDHNARIWAGLENEDIEEDTQAPHPMPNFPMEDITPMPRASPQQNNKMGSGRNGKNGVMYALPFATGSVNASACLFFLLTTIRFSFLSYFFV